MDFMNLSGNDLAGQPNPFLCTTTDYPLVIKTNAQERMRIREDGTVVFPATSMSFLSDIAIQAVGALSLASGSSKAALSVSGVSVGIGTQAPQSPLHVVDHATIGLFASATGGAVGAGMLEVSGPGAGLGLIRQDLTAFPPSPVPGDRFVWSNSDGTLRLSTDGAAELLRFDHSGTLAISGTLGIGTQSPSHPLHVAASAGMRQQYLYLSGQANWQSLFYNAFQWSG